LSLRAAASAIVRGLFAPWTLDRPSASIQPRAAVFITAVFVLAAAAASSALSTWTYLVGKGLLMAAREMDMGQDDLPADSIVQVASGLVCSLIVWTLLLLLVVGVCAAVADLLYRRDRSMYRAAMRRTAAVTVWFVVWAVGVFAVNEVREREIRHPAAAIRAYAQLKQQWFRGSSAWGPGPIEREPLVARGRLRALVAVFPLIWSLVLPRPRDGRMASRLALVGAAIALSWLAWWALWRLLPWTTFEALAG